MSYTEFFWVSSPEVTPSYNIARRPNVGIVIFDSRAQQPGCWSAACYPGRCLDTSPAHVLDLVDRKVRQFEMGTFATVACAVSSPPYEALTIALAGHLPPVVAVPGQRATFPDVEASLPIGASRWSTGASSAVLAAVRRSTTITLAAGSVAAFYTDGLIERRGESIDVGLERLCDVTSPGPPERVAADMMRHLVGDAITTDDIALVVIGRSLSD